MQKNRYIPMVLALLVFTGANAVDTMLSKAKLLEIQQNSITLNKPTITIKDGLDKDSVYFLKLETKTKRGIKPLKAFVDKKTAAVYIGQGYDKDGKVLSFPKDISIIKEGISFSYGKGKKDLYVVTDPECPYCIKFEKSAKGKLEEYRVHVILYPLPYHKKAPAMVEWIMQGKDDKQKKKRFEAVMVDNSQEYKTLIIDEKKPFITVESTKRMIEKSKKAMNELEVRGTPAVFDAKFNSVSWGSLVK